MIGVVERMLDTLYQNTTITVPVTCGAQSARAIWHESGALVEDQQGQLLSTTERQIRYRAWTLTNVEQDATVAVTFPASTITGAARTVAYVVRTVSPLNDGLERVARLVPATP